MALCDQLEAAQAKRESRRNRLAAASLQRISQPEDTGNGEAFRENVRFHLSHLPRLTTRLEHIKELRQAILNLAVRGKLVAQDTEDEPAAELLKRIKTEKEKLQRIKGIRPQKNSESSVTSEQNIHLPLNWIKANLQEVAYLITDGTHLTPKYTVQGKPFLSAQNIKPFRFMPEMHRYVSQEDFNN